MDLVFDRDFFEKFSTGCLIEHNTIESLELLNGLVKISRFCVKQRLCKHCFKNEYTLTFFKNILKGIIIEIQLQKSFNPIVDALTQAS